MSSNIPTQIRTIDPFSSYNSNVVNQLTRMITKNEDCISGSSSSLDIIIDPSSPESGLILLKGIGYKDDVIIEIPENFAFDMNDDDFYLSPDHFNEIGYYYVGLKYTYIKSKPAPEAEIVIFRPSERNSLGSGYIFLKAIFVEFSDGIFQIVSVHDNDPENPLKKREYTKSYVCIEHTLPDYEYDRDNGRTIYVMDRDEMYFGTSDTWESFNAVRTNIDTLGREIGELVYIGPDKQCYLASSVSVETFCDAVVTQIGLSENGTGKVRLFGEVSNVKVETGINVQAGDKLFLSKNEPGTVTNLISDPYNQLVGTCRDVSNGICTMWFSPSFSGGMGGTSLHEKYQELLLDSIFMTLFSDAFINLNYVNVDETTAHIDTSTYRMTGEDGDVFESLLLTDPTCDETSITKCQVSADVSSKELISWFISNNDGVDWQPLFNGLDRIHTFATVEIPTSIEDDFDLLTVGEWCEGSISGKRAIVNMHNESKILLAFETGAGFWVEGEVLTGDESGKQTILTGEPIDITNNKNLKVKCIWSGPAYIDDYCLLYVEDTNKNETSVKNELNIETLFSDIYENGIISNDGNRFYPFLDPNSIPHLNIVSRYSTITEAIVTLDNNILANNPGIGQFLEGDETPSVSERYGSYYTSYTDSTSAIITDFIDSEDGQQINVIHSGGQPITIINNSLIHLSGGEDFVMEPYDVLSLIYSITLGWIEKSRSVNS